MDTLKNKTLMAGEFKDGFDIKPFMTDIKIYEGSRIVEAISQESFRFVKEEENGIERVSIFKHDVYDVYVEIHSEEVCGVIKTRMKCINKTQNEIYLADISSCLVSGVFGNICGRNYDELKACWLKNSWCGEGELVTESLSQMYLPLVNGRNPSSVKTVSSESTFTTKDLFPIAYFVDEKKQSCVAVEIIPCINWNISFRIDRIPCEQYQTLTVFTSSINSARDGHSVKLSGGEEYTTCTSLITTARDIAGCIEKMNGYRRKSDKIVGSASVVFNDYMNCNWAVESEERTKKLIDRAAEAGCEIYCIDSGWYKDENEKDWFGTLGDWNENDRLFGKNGLKGIIDYAASKGVKLGLWFELNVCTKNSEVAKHSDDWFVCSCGKRVFVSGRYFLDLRNEEVRKYLVSRISYFYNLGVRYIKNDYNGTYSTCEAEETNGVCSVGTINGATALLYDEIRQACPEIIIENCASGSMRADHNLLSHVDLQSFSDNEIFYHYPAIISGSLAYQLPEKLGIWTIVYPQLYEFYKDESFLSEEYIQNHSDGEETIFSIISGFFGSMCVSGRLDVADEKNLRLLSEGIKTYKSYRDFISKATPYYPDGDISFYKQSGIAKLGLKHGNKLLLAVWRLNGGESESEIIGKNIKQIFPCESPLHSRTKDGIIIKFTKSYQARLYELNV